jgi:hypothetical protein
MHSTYFETVMAFLGLASIVIGSFADRLTEHVLREPRATSAQRLRSHSGSGLDQSRMSSRA